MNGPSAGFRSTPRLRGGEVSGTELLERTLTYKLNAETHLIFRPGGFHCTIAIPMTDRIATARMQARH